MFSWLQTAESVLASWAVITFLWVFLCACLFWVCCKNRALPVTPKVALTVWIIGMAFPQSQRVTVRIWFTVCNSIAGMSRAFVSYDTIRCSYGTLWQRWKTIINSCGQQGTANHWRTFNTCWTPANTLSFVLKPPLTRQGTEQRFKKTLFTVFHHHSDKTILSKSYSAAICWLWKPRYTAKQYQDLKRHSESDRCFNPHSVLLMTFYKGKGYIISTGKMMMDVRDTFRCWVMCLFCVKLCAASILS